MPSSQRVSIIIPIRYRPDLTRVCLDNLFAYTKDFELILVLEEVNQEINDLVKKYPSKIINNEKALGFPKAVNQGIKVATSDYICFLNNDTVVTPNWLEELLKGFIDKTVGLVVPTCTEIGGRQNVDFNKEGTDFELVADVKGVCMITKKSVLDKLGLLNEQYGLGGGEDNDFAMRIREAGLKTVIARKSFIYHYGSASFRELFNNDIPKSKEYAASRFAMFKRDWKKELGHKPRIFIAIPNLGNMVTQLNTNLLYWTHDDRFEVKSFTPMYVQPFDAARNTCIKEFLEDYWDYLFFIDSDIVPPVETLEKLVAADKDVIGAVCFSWKPDDNGIMFPYPVTVKYAKDGNYERYYGQGIEEVDATGGACLMIKREVLEKVDRPCEVMYHANGTASLDGDFRMCQKFQEAGFKIFIDFSLVCSHYKTINLKDVNNLLLWNTRQVREIG